VLEEAVSALEGAEPVFVERVSRSVCWKSRGKRATPMHTRTTAKDRTSGPGCGYSLSVNPSLMPVSPSSSISSVGGDCFCLSRAIQSSLFLRASLKKRFPFRLSFTHLKGGTCEAMFVLGNKTRTLGRGLVG
jgi:hypothetical protein